MEQDRKPSGGLPATTPEWLSRLLDDVYTEQPDFEQRCQQAATLTWNVGRLRTAHTDRAFEEVSFRTRVENLAQGLEIDLEPILQWFGIVDWSLGTSARGLARLGQNLAVTRDHLLVYVGINELAVRGRTLPGLRRAGATNHSHIERCLEAIRRTHDPEFRAQMRAFEELIIAEYEI